MSSARMVGSLLRWTGERFSAVVPVLISPAFFPRSFIFSVRKLPGIDTCLASPRLKFQLLHLAVFALDVC
jgi:hypothetical protein